jgi:hypothetical protein
MADSLRFLKQGRNPRRVGANIRLRDFEQDGYCFFENAASFAAFFAAAGAIEMTLLAVMALPILNRSPKNYASSRREA